MEIIKEVSVFPQFLETRFLSASSVYISSPKMGAQRAELCDYKMFARYCMHVRMCAAERPKQAANY